MCGGNLYNQPLTKNRAVLAHALALFLYFCKDEDIYKCSDT